MLRVVHIATEKVAVGKSPKQKRVALHKDESYIQQLKALIIAEHNEKIANKQIKKAR